MARKSPKSKYRPYPIPGDSELRVAEAGLAYSLHPHRRAFPAKVRGLRTEYQLTVRDFAEVLETTPKTFTRWMRRREPLSVQQSDRVAVLESIFALGSRVLGSTANLRAWLHSPVHTLNGKIPLELLKTESGRRAVEEALRRIEFGIS